jgi:hypothetical protein
MDTEKGNLRHIYLSAKMPIPIRKNADRVSAKMPTPIRKNAEHNNTDNNTFINTVSAKEKNKNFARAQEKNIDNFDLNSQLLGGNTPQKNEVVQYFIEAGASKASGERFFNEFEAVNWIKKGQKIIKWQNLADSWVKNEPNMKKATGTINTKNLQRKQYPDYD